MQEPDSLSGDQWARKGTKEWAEWQEICRYTGWNPEGPLKPMKYRGHILPFNSNLGVGAEFYNELVARINKIKAIRIAIVGPAGVGKTYMAIHLARIIGRKFTIKQVIFTRKDYMRLARTLKPKKVIIIEEPTYIASARTWFNAHQQIVVRTLESSRFQNNPIIIPVVNRMLLDKIIREHYINYVIEMRDRGVGYVYRTNHDQWQTKLWRTKISEIYAYQPGVEIARCNRETCLGCKQLATCEKNIWPRYERKREEAVNEYQAEDASKLETKKSAGQKFKTKCDRAIKIAPTLIGTKGRYSTAMIMYTMQVNRQDARLMVELLTLKKPLN